MYAGFRYNYRRGIDNLLVLLIGGIPIAMYVQNHPHAYAHAPTHTHTHFGKKFFT
ncbi:hypothetical protein BX666DRAFT_2006488, partial [Dichotomocladium elegans]